MRPAQELFQLLACLFESVRPLEQERPDELRGQRRVRVCRLPERRGAFHQVGPDAASEQELEHRGARERDRERPGLAEPLRELERSRNRRLGSS